MSKTVYNLLILIAVMIGGWVMVKWVWGKLP